MINFVCVLTITKVNTVLSQLKVFNSNSILKNNILSVFITKFCVTISKFAVSFILFLVGKGFAASSRGRATQALRLRAYCANPFSFL